MKRSLRAASILFAVLATAAPAADESPASAAARAQLTGTWKGYAVEGMGEQPDRGPVKLELIIDRASIHGLETKGEGLIDHGSGGYTLDPAAQPGILDASQTNERGRAQSWVGIYRQEGDTFYWCVARKTRPTTFETVKGQFLLILKRGPAAK